MQARRGRKCVFLLRRAVVVCAVAGALASAPAAFAQVTQPGSIQGRVLDTTGLPLPAVLVEVESTGTPLLARTGADGRYIVDPVPGWFGTPSDSRSRASSRCFAGTSR